jgi:hypothetical protein
MMRMWFAAVAQVEAQKIVVDERLQDGHEYDQISTSPTHHGARGRAEPGTVKAHDQAG